MKSEDAVEAKSSPPTYGDDKEITRTVSSDAEYGHAVGDVVPIGTTKRGLKARHAQMIALGGTIGETS